jgi:hypothetical protein
MKTLYSLAILLVAGTWANAQITITNTSFPAVGDMLHTATDPNPLLNITAASNTAQSWDYSAFVPSAVETVPVLDAATGAAAASFPSAELLLPAFGGEGYVDVTSSAGSIVGFYGDPGIGTFFTVPFIDPLVLFSAPINYGQTMSDVGKLAVAFNPNDIPPLADQIPDNIDSMRVRIDLVRHDTADAFGQLKTHLGQFDVLRVKRTTYTDLTVEAKVPFIGWVDVELLGITLPIPTKDTTDQYDFLAEGHKVAVLSLSKRGDLFGGGYSTTVAVYETDPSLLSAAQVALQPISIAPNPANDNVQITFGADVPYVNLQIADLNGRVWSSQQNVQSGYSFSVASLPVGLYIAYLTDSKGRLVARSKISVTR